jgi:hypothetical protein
VSPTTGKIDATATTIDETTPAHVPREWLFQEEGVGGVVATDSAGTPLNEVYFFGLIDILIRFGARKKMENAGKSIVYDPVIMLFNSLYCLYNCSVVSYVSKLMFVASMAFLWYIQANMRSVLWISCLQSQSNWRACCCTCIIDPNVLTMIS